MSAPTATETDDFDVVKAALLSWAGDRRNARKVLTIPALLDYIHGPAEPGKRRRPGRKPIVRWCEDGSLPARKDDIWFFAADAVDRWLANGMQP